MRLPSSPGFGLLSRTSTILRVANSDKIVGAGREPAPAEAAIGRVQLAHREIRALGRGANLLERLIDEQRLVAGDEIDLGQTVGQVPLELPQR